MNCRDFIIEFEERGALTEAAQIHRNDCPGCRKVTIVQTQIWESIENLPKINAPQNFDFRVKARIASARPSDFQPRFLPALRYVLPISLIVLVVGVLAFNTSLFSGNNGSPEIAQATNLALPLTETKPGIVLPPVQPVVNSNIAQSFTNEGFSVNTANLKTKTNNKPEIEYFVSNSTRKNSSVPQLEVSKDESEGGGSRDTAATKPEVLTQPFNLGGTPSVNVSRGNNNGILGLIGLEIVSENGNQTIKSIKPGSLAARAGLRLGDVIEEVDGVKLTASMVASEKMEVKTLTVRRGTERLEIFLGN